MFIRVTDTNNNYAASTSTDGSNYTDALSGTGALSTDISGTARYIKIAFTDGEHAINEVNVFGWSFNNIGKYVFDGTDIYLGATETEHDTNEVYANLVIKGQATYEIITQDASRVLTEGDELIVTPCFGNQVTYTLHLDDK